MGQKSIGFLSFFSSPVLIKDFISSLDREDGLGCFKLNREEETLHKGKKRHLYFPPTEDLWQLQMKVSLAKNNTLHFLSKSILCL